MRTTLIKKRDCRTRRTCRTCRTVRHVSRSIAYAAPPTQLAQAVVRGGAKQPQAVSHTVAAERRPLECKKRYKRLFFSRTPQKGCGEKRGGVSPRGAPQAPHRVRGESWLVQPRLKALRQAFALLKTPVCVLAFTPNTSIRRNFLEYHYFNRSRMRSSARSVAVASPKAVSRKYPSPNAPKPLPGVPTTSQVSSSRSKKSKDFSPLASFHQM